MKTTRPIPNLMPPDPLRAAESVGAEKSIPHMLEAFMAGGRGFGRGSAMRRSPPMRLCGA